MSNQLEDLCKLHVSSLVNDIQIFNSKNRAETNEQVKMTNLIMFSSQLYTLLLSYSDKDLFETFCHIIIQEFHKYKLDKDALFFNHFVNNKKVMAEMNEKTNKKGGGMFSFFLICTGVLAMSIMSVSKPTEKNVLVNTLVEMRKNPSLPISVYNFFGTCVTNSLIFEMFCRGVPKTDSAEVANLYDRTYDAYYERQTEDFKTFGMHDKLGIPTGKFLELTNFTHTEEVDYSSQIKSAYREPLLEFSNRKDNVIVSVLDVKSAQKVGGEHALNLFMVFRRNELGVVDPDSLKICLSDADLLAKFDAGTDRFVFSDRASIFCEEGVFNEAQLSKLGSMVQVLENPLEHYLTTYRFEPHHFQTPANAIHFIPSDEPYTHNMNNLVDIYDGVHTQIVKAIRDSSDDFIQSGKAADVDEFSYLRYLRGNFAKDVDEVSYIRDHFDTLLGPVPNYDYIKGEHTDDGHPANENRYYRPPNRSDTIADISSLGTSSVVLAGLLANSKKKKITGGKKKTSKRKSRANSQRIKQKQKRKYTKKIKKRKNL